MTLSLTARKRFARLYVDGKIDRLFLVKLDGTEGISENFLWEIDCITDLTEAPVKPDDLIGKPCHVEVDSKSGTRHLHGICTSTRFCGWRGGHMLYRLVLRPWTWLATLVVKCKIFHEKKVDDIIKDVLEGGSYGGKVEFKLQGTFESIPYCVQYQETDFDFVLRLMEKYGLYFYFEHSASEHKLVIVDDQTNLPNIPAYNALPFRPETGSGEQDEALTEWWAENRLRTASVKVDDYHYETPKLDLVETAQAPDNPGHAHNALEAYIYPAGHREKAAGQSLADVRIGIVRAEAERKFGRGIAPLIHAGGVFTLVNHPIRDENTRHAAVRVMHLLFVNHYLSDAGGNQFALDLSLNEIPTAQAPGDRYFGEYEAVVASKVYRSPMQTPPPRINGAQTAEVIREKSSPADEEIDVDDQGRILVRFHWNEAKATSDACSCRVRVAQPWAGPQWGSVWIPRVGQEVVVEFLEGDPDRPLITGAVYNGTNKPPVSLPANKTQSTIKSDSSKGGQGANELRFEDKKDDEEIYIHAERDRRMEIEHDDDVTIGASQSVTIGGNRTYELTGGDETTTLKGAPGTKDKYGNTITKNGHRTTVLEMGDDTLKVEKGKRTTTIKGHDERTIESGDDKHTVKSGNQTVNLNRGNQTTTLKLGNQTTKMSAGKGTVNAMQSYEIKVGGSSIKISPMSITIKSPTITIDASMNLTAKGGIGGTFQGGATCTVKGGIVMIN